MQTRKQEFLLQREIQGFQGLQHPDLVRLHPRVVGHRETVAEPGLTHGASSGFRTEVLPLTLPGPSPGRVRPQRCDPWALRPETQPFIPFLLPTFVMDSDLQTPTQDLNLPELLREPWGATEVLEIFPELLPRLSVWSEGRMPLQDLFRGIPLFLLFWRSVHACPLQLSSAMLLVIPDTPLEDHLQTLLSATLQPFPPHPESLLVATEDILGGGPTEFQDTSHEPFPGSVQTVQSPSEELPRQPIP